MGNKTPCHRKVSDLIAVKTKNPEETGLKTGASSGA